MKELDIEKRRTDSLLYQMIPRTVADRLRHGEPALNTCEVCANYFKPLHVTLLNSEGATLFRDRGREGVVGLNHFFPWVDFLGLQMTLNKVMYEFHHLVVAQLPLILVCLGQMFSPTTLKWSPWSQLLPEGP